MFLLLGVSILLTVLLTFNGVASVVSSVLWGLVGKRATQLSGSTSARLLFLLRTLPAAIGLGTVVLLLAPAYLLNEPRATAETISLKLALVASASAIGIVLAVIRGVASWRATARLAADWLSRGELISIPGVRVPAYRIEHRFPVIAIVGVFRPRLFIASQILDSLTNEEVSAALAHENGHLATRDNLKRGLLRACRDALLIIPCGRSLDRAWAEASEAAADEYAAEGGRQVALNLAAALVKIARMIPKGVRPMMPAGAFLLGEDEIGGVKARVRRLLNLAASHRKSCSRDRLIAPFLMWTSLLLLCLSIVFATSNGYFLGTVYAMIEHVVFILS
jgi:Zn-dependent protease with chaperone function